MICGIKDAKSKRLKTMISFIYHSGRDKTNLTCKKKKKSDCDISWGRCRIDWEGQREISGVMGMTGV